MPTAPLYGFESKLAGGKAGEIEQAVLKEEGVELSDFKVKALPESSSKGGRKMMVLKPEKLKPSTTRCSAQTLAAATSSAATLWRGMSNSTSRGGLTTATACGLCWYLSSGSVSGARSPPLDGGLFFVLRNLTCWGGMR